MVREDAASQPQAGARVPRAVVERAQHGDREAFAELVAAMIGRLNGAAHLLVRDPDRARDAVQETLIRAWRDLPSLRDPSRFEPWLRRLLLNACIDQSRRERRYRLDVALTEVDDDGRGNPIARISDRDELERAFARIHDDHRAILVQRFYLGASLEEICETLGIPLGTAKSRLHRAIEAMRVELNAGRAHDGVVWAGEA